MANYLLVYVGGGEMPTTQEGRDAAMAAWGGWMGGLGESLKDPGNPFGPSATVATDGSSTAGTGTGQTGYSIIAADSLESAIEKTQGCPILAGGGSVQVYETFNVM